MVEILRWYISRIYKDQKFVNGRYQFIDVKIVPKKKDIKLTPDYLIKKKSDELKWWTDIEELFIYGFIDESLLINLLENKNCKPQSNLKTIKKRRITEGTVLLQFLNESVKLSTYLNRLRKRKNKVNLKKLATIKDSNWLDFTQPARKMSSTVYNGLLRSGGEINEVE